MAQKTRVYADRETDEFYDRKTSATTEEMNDFFSTYPTGSEETKVRRENPYAHKKKKGSRQTEQTPHLRQERRSFNWSNAKSRINFFLCAALVTLGCLLVIIQYVQVFGINVNIEKLRDELTDVEADNDVIKAGVQGDTMNMDALYSYATTALGMIESGEDTIVYITVYNQSYTTSSLPVQEIPDSKVAFHWFD